MSGGENSPFTTVPSTYSGSHQVAACFWSVVVASMVCVFAQMISLFHFSAKLLRILSWVIMVSERLYWEKTGLYLYSCIPASWQASIAFLLADAAESHLACENVWLKRAVPSGFFNVDWSVFPLKRGLAAVTRILAFSDNAMGKVILPDSLAGSMTAKGKSGAASSNNRTI